MGYTLVQTQTASNDTEIDFTIDGTYDEIMFSITNFKPGTDQHEIEWQVITSSYGSYNRGIQSAAYHISQNFNDSWGLVEDANSPTAQQHSSDALTQAFMQGAEGSTTTGAAGDATQFSSSGYLIFFRPQETGHWKHFQGNSASVYTGDGSLTQTYNYCFSFAGYVKELQALTGIRFKCLTGNISVGTFSMYGLA